MWERETESLFERGVRETLSSQKNQVEGKARMWFREPFEYKDNSAHCRPVERGSWDWVSLGVVQSSGRWASSQSQMTGRHRCVTFPDHLIPWSLSGFCGEWDEYMHPAPHGEVRKLNESAGKYLYAQAHEAWQRSNTDAPATQIKTAWDKCYSRIKCRVKSQMSKGCGTSGGRAGRESFGIYWVRVCVWCGNSPGTGKWGEISTEREENIPGTVISSISLRYHLLWMLNSGALLHMVISSEYLAVMLSFINPTFSLDLISRSNLFRASKPKRLMPVLSLTS